MILKTERLILRPWEETDAESLYKYAKNPNIGPSAGWPVHTSIENSRQIIKEVLSAEGTYAVIMQNEPIGSIGLMMGEASNLGIADNEAEIGYWIAEPYWGQGLIPEAMNELMRYAFEDLVLETIWCGYFEGNEKSKRVQEKCGLQFHHTDFDQDFPLIDAIKIEHVTRITKEEWLEK